MKVYEICNAIERTAPLRLQDEWDNSGLQAGLPGAEVGCVLVCLDITEDIVEEAASKGCNMIVSHHPLIFKPLRQVCGLTYQQRCVARALALGIAIYSAHTSLDNARGGVNFRIADIIGLQELEWLSPRSGEDAGSGLIGNLPEPVEDRAFIGRLASLFGVQCIRHGACSGKAIRRVALCGGAGAFLMKDAIRQGADCFVSGEFHYHDYFETDGQLLAELGHYQSEKFTVDLLRELLLQAFPGLKVITTSIDTNPICYGIR
ncbi:MAG: Nif3-like dinuclear metal center hexameric protein [Bacteroidales bacterium]|nr:Nif3-like dinuclear metal center hexameric protein [Bacteroidales bacterium]